MSTTLSTCGVLAGAAVVYWLGLGRAHLAEIAERRVLMAAAYERFEATERELAHETALLDCAARLERCRAELDARLTPDPEHAPFLLAATSELKATGLTVERSDALPDDPSLGMPNRRARVVVSGTLGRLLVGLCTLENAAAPTRVTELTLQAGDGTKVRGELTIVRTWSQPR